MRLTIFLVSLFAVLSISACDQRVTYYPSQIAAAQSTSWRVVDVRINIPNTMISTEENSLMPEADIVWREEAFGDRKQQVSAILDQAITSAASRLSGGRGVYFDVTLLRFHALTERARRTTGGLHKVRFMISVVDADSGAVIVEPVLIEADEFALSGSEAQQAVAAGQTQRVRIINRVQLVVLNWLGVATAEEQVELGKISHIGK